MATVVPRSRPISTSSQSGDRCRDTTYPPRCSIGSTPTARRWGSTCPVSHCSTFKQRKRRYGAMLDGAGPLLDVDIADPDAGREFQRRHHVTTDGVVGPETREALHVARQQRLNGSGACGDGGRLARLRRRDARDLEALLYSFAVPSSSTGYGFVAPIVGAGIGFSWPWAFLPLLRKLTNNVAEWKQETVIGTILVSVAAAFGLLHMVGVFG